MVQGAQSRTRLVRSLNSPLSHKPDAQPVRDLSEVRSVIERPSIVSNVQDEVQLDHGEWYTFHNSMGMVLYAPGQPLLESLPVLAAKPGAKLASVFKVEKLDQENVKLLTLAGSYLQAQDTGKGSVLTHCLPGSEPEQQFRLQPCGQKSFFIETSCMRTVYLLPQEHSPVMADGEPVRSAQQNAKFTAEHLTIAEVELPCTVIDLDAHWDVLHQVDQIQAHMKACEEHERIESELKQKKQSLDSCLRELQVKYTFDDIDSLISHWLWIQAAETSLENARQAEAEVQKRVDAAKVELETAERLAKERAEIQDQKVGLMKSHTLDLILMEYRQR